MTNLYKILETNTDETKKQDTKKFDFLFDLEGNSYKISDIENAKLFKENRRISNNEREQTSLFTGQ